MAPHVNLWVEIGEGIPIANENSRFLKASCGHL